MEIIPTTIQGILRSLKRRAEQRTTPVIVDALIAITPDAEVLLDVHPSENLETIRY